MPAPDGVLGEYQIADRSITLFSPMIELAAADAASVLQRPVSDVVPLMRTLVEVHELAHAHVHLGRDADDRIWAAPEQATHGFHEALAQVYTRRIVRKLEPPELWNVLRVMEDWLPIEYHYADLLAVAGPEDLRSYVVERRSRPPARTLAAVAAGILRGLPGYVLLLQDQLPGGALGASTARALADTLARADRALDTPQEASAVLDVLLRRLEELPQAKAILGAFVPGGWPSAKERRWLLFEASVAGEPVGKKPLRFIRKEDIVRAVDASKSAQEIGLRPALRVCKKAVARLCVLAGRQPDDERFGVSVATKAGPGGRGGHKHKRRRRSSGDKGETPL
jgi:hypothetical protein